MGLGKGDINAHTNILGTQGAGAVRALALVDCGVNMCKKITPDERVGACRFQCSAQGYLSTSHALATLGGTSPYCTMHTTRRRHSDICIHTHQVGNKRQDHDKSAGTWKWTYGATPTLT